MLIRCEYMRGVMVCMKGCDGLMVAYLTDNRTGLNKCEDTFTIGCLVVGIVAGCD